MKFSENWLREWVDPGVDTDELSEQLTLLGLEVDEVNSAAPDFRDVVVVEVTDVQPHPGADRLRVCSVDDGSGESVQIVCGAPNVHKGMFTALAKVGGKLPDGSKLRKAKLRGVESNGMLCSAAELELSEQRDGLIELSGDAQVGQGLADYLQLDDNIFTVELTPDRGDCLSIRGMARDLCARNNVPLTIREFTALPAQHDKNWQVKVDDASACARYASRVISGVNLSSATPMWMSERLRRSGVRTINAAVDVTNYVMLELGQPMHAFDLDKVQGPIQVRLAEEGEKIHLLDDRIVTLQDDTTVIADNTGAIGIAGIMGGLSTAVSKDTTTVFLESALFLPEQIIGKPRRYNSQSESSHRFERGVDPALQVDALEYATELLIAICGGEPGVANDWQNAARLPSGDTLCMRRQRLGRILGMTPDANEVERILSRLGIDCVPDNNGWQVTPPSHRYDLRIEEDYIEEVGRVIGFENLPRTSPAHHPEFRAVPEDRVPTIDIKTQLANRGYQEVITYSFVDARQQQILRPDLPALPLANPISQDMSDMRTTLIGGLINTMRHNQARQISALRIFETGLRFVDAGGKNGQASLDTATLDKHILVSHGDDIQIDDRLWQQAMIAGLVVGRIAPENWNTDTRSADFFDVKADLEALFVRANGARVEFTDTDCAMLHPGQRAAITCNGIAAGYMGSLSPDVQKQLDLAQPPVVFELSLAALREARVPQASPLSRYPSVRRDLAWLVDEHVSHSTLIASVVKHAPNWLVDIRTFDVYSGNKIDKGKKSIALGLIMQDFSRTLEEAEVEQAVARIVEAADQELGAVLRV